MRPSGTAVVVLMLLALPASAQEAAMSSTAQRFTFDTPSDAGLRSYTMVSSSISATHSVRSWISAGTSLHLARASMAAQGTSRIDVSGLSGAEIFAALRRGRLDVRATYTPAISRTRLTSESLVVAGLASAEVLPFPVRGWGRGSGYAVDATIRVGSAVEFFGSLGRHGWFTPLENDPSQYRLGNEVRVGTRLSSRPSTLSRIEAGILVSRSGSDEDDRQQVFSPGMRFRVHAAAIFPIGYGTVMLRGDIYRRGSGRVFDPVATIEGVPGSVLGGGSRSDARTVTSASFESRSSAGSVPLIVTVGGRVGEGATEDWLIWGGIGAEVEIRPPIPGRWYLVPMGRIYRGETAPARNFESGMAAWEFSVALHWDGR